MVAFWKVRREVDRIVQQSCGVAGFITDRVAQSKLDAMVAEGLPAFVGKNGPSEKMAIFIIYQPNRLAQSSIDTIRWLSGQGYAVLVVSNAPLNQECRTRLAPWIWRGIERPNFGYDFGGYRDGIQFLAQQQIRPKTLLVLNDSFWMPVVDGSEIILRLEDSPADIAGTILRDRNGEQFLESYIYRINRRVLESDAFKDYWAGLVLTSNKFYVIRRGERGFSAAMRSAGFSLAGVYDGRAPLRLENWPEPELRKTLTFAAYTDSALQRENRRLLASGGSGWKAHALAHISDTLRKYQGYSSFPFAMIRLEGYPVLKKSMEPVHRNWRAAYMAAVSSGELPAPPPVILSEIRARDS